MKPSNEIKKIFQWEKKTNLKKEKKVKTNFSIHKYHTRNIS